jgi:cysteine-rich repeat protein
MKLWTPLLAALLLVACGGDDDNNNNNNNPPGNRCGDGVVRGMEQCDDGNTVSGDGCSATCLNEIVAVCGDNMVEGNEECDDGNTTNGDGCSAVCTTETGPGNGTCASPFVLMVTNTNGTLQGSGEGDTSTSTNQVGEALCDGFNSGAGKDHVWKFTLTAPSDVYILMDDASEFDTVMRVLGSPCDTATEIAEYTGADGCADGEGAEEFMGYVALAAGTYYIVIDGYEAGDEGMYAFDFMAIPTTCGDGELDPLEFCDDGNSATSDGCNTKCEVEDGYTCDFSSPSVCMMDSTSVSPAPGDLVLNEIMAGDNTSDTNCDGSITGTRDEFVELVNVSNKTLDLGGVTIADSVIVRHTFGSMALPPGKAVVVWGGGTPMCAGVTMFDVASTGQLGLNDAGDTITIAVGTTELVKHTYPAATLNVSFNLSPDVSGTTYVLHNALAGSVGAFSPGKRANNTAF